MSMAVMNQEIEKKARSIAELVAASLDMAIFKQAEADLRNDPETQSLLRDLQEKEAAGEDVDAVFERLEARDVFRRFTVAQENLAEVVQNVSRIVAATVSGRLDLVQLGGGCGSCSAEGCDGKSGLGSASCDGHGASDCSSAGCAV
jgi:cell fate (sporulation/competence/biofilm development) regulator YlbF (YheA/YmcA/DUF963 family)